jgi:hypothetical protein
VEITQLAVLEALADPRVAGPDRSLTAPELEEELAELLPTTSWQDLEQQGLVERWGDRVQLVVDGETALDELTAGREIEWETGTVTQGDVLAGFARHCRDNYDQIEVLDEGESRLVLRCEGEECSLELRAGFLFCDRLADDRPLLLLGELSHAAVQRFVADERLRSAVAVYDLARLEKVDAVRSSAFVYFERFLRETYRVELVPANSFTQGLADRGIIISLGTG